MCDECRTKTCTASYRIKVISINVNPFLYVYFVWIIIVRLTFSKKYEKQAVSNFLLWLPFCLVNVLLAIIFP